MLLILVWQVQSQSLFCILAEDLLGKWFAEIAGLARLAGLAVTITCEGERKGGEKQKSVNGRDVVAFFGWLFFEGLRW